MALRLGYLIDNDPQTTLKANTALRVGGGDVDVMPDPPPPPPPPRPNGPNGGGGGGGGGGGSRSSGGGGGGGAKKSSDKPQLAALKEMIDKGFAQQRDAKLKNIRTLYAQQDAELLAGFRGRMDSLLDSEEDNRLAREDMSFDVLANRLRESMSLLGDAAVQGAGETDVMRSQLMAVRNYDANQGDVDREFFDGFRSARNAMNDLNFDARTARINLASESLSDQEQVWANYQNQLADAWTQIGNIHANPYSDSHKSGSNAFSNVAKATATHWTHGGVNEDLRNWQGQELPEPPKLNSSTLGGATKIQAQKKPEGSTLRSWT